MQHYVLYFASPVIARDVFCYATTPLACITAKNTMPIYMNLGSHLLWMDFGTLVGKLNCKTKGNIKSRQSAHNHKLLNTANQKSTGEYFLVVPKNGPLSM